MKFFVVCFWFSLAAIVLGSPTKAIVGGRNIFAESTERMPYDAEVEYLESTGTQWIDTGISTDSIYAFSFEFAIPNGATQSTWGSVLSGRLDNFTLGLAPSNQLYIRYRGTDLPNRPKYEYDIWNTFSLSQDGVLIIQNHQSQQIQPVSTFADTLVICNNSYGNRPTSIKFRLLKCYDEDGFALIDMISVRFTNELGQSEGAMYDRVSGALFRNAGAGAFIIGPDKH